MSEPSAQALLVEELSLFFEESALPRMAGRILGWLLICEPEEQSAGELVEALQASKGSISMMTRLLMKLGFVERIGVPARREKYFRLRPGVWSELLGAEVAKVSTGRMVAEKGLELIPPGSSATARLEEMRDLYAFMERELPVLLAAWEEQRTKTGSRGETFSLPAA